MKKYIRSNSVITDNGSVKVNYYLTKDADKQYGIEVSINGPESQIKTTVNSITTSYGEIVALAKILSMLEVFPTNLYECVESYLAERDSIAFC